MGFIPRRPIMGGIMAARMGRNVRQRGGMAEPYDQPEPMPEPTPVPKPVATGYKPGTKPGMPPEPGIGLPGVGVPSQKPYLGTSKPPVIRPPEINDVVTEMTVPEQPPPMGMGKRKPISRWNW